MQRLLNEEVNASAGQHMYVIWSEIVTETANNIADTLQLETAFTAVFTYVHGTMPQCCYSLS